MAVYGPSYAEELYHWKYKYKKRINGKWRYYYDETNLNKNNYKTLDDAMKLHKTQKNYAFKSIAENWNAKHAGTMLTDDERETAKAMSEYYAEKSKYYESVYQEVLDQLGEETMMNASIYMVNTWDGHDEFKKKYFDKVAAEIAAEEEAERKADEYATQEEADDAAELARMAEEARAAVQEYAKKYGNYHSSTRGFINNKDLNDMTKSDEKKMKEMTKRSEKVAKQLKKKLKSG